MNTIRMPWPEGQGAGLTVARPFGASSRGRNPLQQQRERLELRALELGCRFDLAQVAADRWLRREVLQ